MVTLTGYRFERGLSIDSSNLEINLISDQISRFYCHDDQCGPFSRLVFLDKDKSWKFKTSVWSSSFSNEQEKANPYCLIVPLTKKLNVVYEDILDEASVIDHLLNTFFKEKIKLTWDIYLCKSNDYKVEIKKELSGKDPKHLSVLYKSLPQYIWVSKVYFGTNNEKVLVFDLIYDAIDVNYVNSPFSATIYDETFEDFLVSFDSGIETDSENLITLKDVLGYFDTNKSTNLVSRYNRVSKKIEQGKLNSKEIENQVFNPKFGPEQMDKFFE